MTRTTYDTSVKHLYRLGLQSTIPLEIRNAIPKSNIHRWRNEDDAKYIGFDLNQFAGREMDEILAFVKSKRWRQIFRASLRISKTLLSLVDVKAIEDALRSQKEKVVVAFPIFRQRINIIIPFLI